MPAIAPADDADAVGLVYQLLRTLRCPVDLQPLTLRGGVPIHRLWECPACGSDFREAPPKGKFWSDAEIGGA